MLMRAGVPPVPMTRYEISAPYVGLGVAKNPCALPLPDAPKVGASPHWNAVFGSNNITLDAKVFAFSCSRGAMSTIQKLRPCVEAISSRSRG